MPGSQQTRHLPVKLAFLWRHFFDSVNNRTFMIALVVIPAIHIALSKLSASIALEQGMTPIWPTVGFYVAVILLFGYRLFPILVFSELLANFTMWQSTFPQNTVAVLLIYVISSTIDPLIIPLLYKRWIPQEQFFSKVQNIFKYSLIILPSAIVNTTISIAVTCWGGAAPWSVYGDYWRQSYVMMTTTLFTLTPILLAWAPQTQHLVKFNKRQLPELGLTMLVLGLICQIMFMTKSPLEYVLLIPLLWAAFRMGAQVATGLLLLVEITVLTAAKFKLGSFADKSVFESMSLLQSFMAVAALITFTTLGIVNENKRAEDRLRQANDELEQRVEERTAELSDNNIKLNHTLEELRRTQTQMIQTEKMSALGQMVAGVAHEINNPVGFIHGNLKHLSSYTDDILNLVQVYQQYFPNPPQAIQEQIESIDLAFLKEDFPELLRSMQVGTDRIREIVLSLRNFSRLDEAEFKTVDLHEGIDNTLLILRHRLEATAHRPLIEIIKDYGELPLVECYAGQLNQVFMNILSNAIDALEEANQERTKAQIENRLNTICIHTSVQDNNWVKITITDNGNGIPENACGRLFDPFFTTKSVGKGTGLGLSISYQIVTEKHHGKIWCDSTPGKGTKFCIEIPVRQTFLN
ncbi:putative histidine kinase [Calothrix sp. NIES-4071]|nr:putative histidine kinase [Calothrix sp. NIES-4071]BAZ59895.1 putative histidine kinase [Calothrix sp. NIES-4105]